jgi:hypothetical protein
MSNLTGEGNATPLLKNPTLKVSNEPKVVKNEPNWLPLIASISAAGLFLIIVASILFICFKFRRSE